MITVKIRRTNRVGTVTKRAFRVDRFETQYRIEQGAAGRAFESGRHIHESGRSDACQAHINPLTGRRNDTPAAEIITLRSVLVDDFAEALWGDR